MSPDLGPKRLQLVKEIMPSASRVALLWNPDNISNSVILEQMRDAAPALGLAFTAVEARSAGDFDGAFAILARERPDAVLLTSDPMHHSQHPRIIDFLLQNRLPGMFQTRDDAVAGGLMSYGAIFPEMFAPGRFLRAEDIARHQAGRHSGADAAAIRAGHQSQDRQGDRRDDLRSACCCAPTR